MRPSIAMLAAIGALAASGGGGMGAARTPIPKLAQYKECLPAREPRRTLPNQRQRRKLKRRVG